MGGGDAFLGGGDAFFGGGDAFFGGGDAFFGDGDAFLEGGDAFFGGGDAFLEGGDAFLGGGVSMYTHSQRVSSSSLQFQRLFSVSYSHSSITYVSLVIEKHLLQMTMISSNAMNKMITNDAC